MPLRAIDFHVHLPTPDWLDGSMARYLEAAEAYFRSPVQRQSLGELADQYRRLEVKAVLLAWDAETATARPRVPNETVAAACRDYPDVFTGMGSVDPHTGEAAVPVGQRLPVHRARAVPVRAGGAGPALRGDDRGAARQRGAGPAS
jgi:predicted TIM-barrel fold metal-dependent hydrolase